MILYRIIVLAGFLIGSLHAQGIPTPVVQTNKGPIQGEILQTAYTNVSYASFRGIPYAKPPVGNLRFRPPVETEPWNTTLRTVNDASECIQINPFSKVIEGEEDCLYLNVYTPLEVFQESPPRLRAVMFWIHGGGFSLGNTNSSMTSPDLLVEDDVVVVTVNYRLGPIGFLSLWHKDISGNCGLKDHLLGMKWVQKNIALFGGDPNQVTIFGESAGSALVDLHVLSPASRGLFNGSITQSGSVLNPWGFHPPRAAIQGAYEIGNLLGFNANTADELADFLYNVPAAQLVNASAYLKNQFIPWRPTYENSSLHSSAQQFLTKCPWEIYKKGEFTQVPQITGYMAQEALSVAGVLTAIVDNSTEYLNLLSGSSNNNLLLSLFIKGLVLSNATNTINAAITAAEQILTDILFVGGIDLRQRLMSRFNKYPIYYYNMSYDSPYSLHRLSGLNASGAAHTDDDGYIWHMPIYSDVVPTDLDEPPTPFRKQLVEMWTNFAKTGNPTPNGSNDTSITVTWPDSRKWGQQLIIDEPLTVTSRRVRPLAKLTEVLAAATAPASTGC